MDASRAAAHVRQLCEADLDARMLRAQVLQEIGRVVSFDGYAWLLTDPLTWVGIAPLADVPWLSELPRHIQLKYSTMVNRWTGLGNTHVGLLHAATGGELSQSLLWRELLHAHDVGDVASVVFPDQHGCWGFLELFKDVSRGPFSTADAAFLAGLVAPLTLAIRRAQANCFESSARHDRILTGPVVLLLSPQLQVLGQTPDTHDYLRTLLPPAQNRQPIPASAYNVAAQLLALQAGVDSHPATARVHLSNGVWVTLRAARVDGPGVAQPQNIAVSIEESSPAERLDMFARTFGLSERETQLLEHLATGSDTKALASQLFLSQHTVQDHLKSIFAKTNTRSRPGLLSRALGT
jgi:DNA-binding CsgD family transcriptional regulator